jgi:hypothetical protein
MSPNKMVISLEGNDELKEYLSKKSPGDTCEFEVTASMDEMTPDQATFSVKSAEAYSDEEEAPMTEEAYTGEGEAAVPEKGPAAVMIAFGKKK